MQTLKNHDELVSEAKIHRSLGTEVTSLADMVTKQIRESIITGEFAPGQRLKEDELCKMFDISRPPIREAFKTLQANGILVHKPRKGVLVAEFTVQDVEEVYTIISMLYHKTTDIAMDIITNQQIGTLKRHLDRMKRAVQSEPYDVREYQLAHGDFHQFIMQIAGYKRIKELERQLRDQVFIFSFTSFQEKKHLDSSLEYHIKIFEAIQEKNKDKALELMEEHVCSALKYLKDKYPDNEDTSSTPKSLVK